MTLQRKNTLHHLDNRSPTDAESLSPCCQSGRDLPLNRKHEVLGPAAKPEQHQTVIHEV